MKCPQSTADLRWIRVQRVYLPGERSYNFIKLPIGASEQESVAIEVMNVVLSKVFSNLIAKDFKPKEAQLTFDYTKKWFETALDISKSLDKLLNTETNPLKSKRLQKESFLNLNKMKLKTRTPEDSVLEFGLPKEVDEEEPVF